MKELTMRNGEVVDAERNDDGTVTATVRIPESELSDTELRRLKEGKSNADRSIAFNGDTDA